MDWTDGQYPPIELIEVGTKAFECRDTFAAIVTRARDAQAIERVWGIEGHRMWLRGMVAYKIRNVA